MGSSFALRHLGSSLSAQRAFMVSPNHKEVGIFFGSAVCLPTRQPLGGVMLLKVSLLFQLTNKCNPMWHQCDATLPL